VVREIDTPRAERPGEAVIRVGAAMFGAALMRAVSVGHPKVAPPAVLGTLVAGEVVEVGGAGGGLAPGDVVTIDPHPPCGQCENCRDGTEALCSARPGIEPGAHAEYVRIGPLLAARSRRVPSGVGLDAAVLTEIVACVLDATRVARIGPGQDVVVIGCGPVAMIQIQAALHAGARRVICTVNRDGRAAMAARFGAVPVDARDDRAEESILDLTAGRGAHVVVEAVGRAETYEQALRLVRPGGTVVGFGGCPPGSVVRLDPNDLHYRRVSLVGSYHYADGGFDAALAALASGAVDVAPLITHRLPLERVPGVLDLARDESCMTVIVQP
jgi:L-iditol 2-dehydrogenase